MKKSELKHIIREEVEKTLKEEKNIYSQASDKAKQLMMQLEDLALNGEIGNQDIDELRARLRSARSKMFASRKSPEDRQAAAQKSTTTKKLQDILSAEHDKAMKQLGYEDDSIVRFALRVGMYKNKNIQNKYNEIVTKGFLNTAALQGFDTDVATKFIKGIVF
jgi:predicted  nucleic acid-binding Zn-ribbon protein